MALTRFAGGNVSGFPARLRRRPAGRRWMARGPVALLLLLALALAVGVLPAQAQAQADTLVSNLDQPHGNDTPGLVGTVQINNSFEHRRTAQRFSTGGNPHGYTLSDVRAYISGRTSGAAVSVSIHSADSSGKPASSLYQLENPDSIANNSLNTFTAEDGATLERETDYFVVFEAPTGRYSVEIILDNDEDAGRAEGWSIRNGRHRKIDDNSWSGVVQPVRIEINGTVNDIKLVSNLGQEDRSSVERAGISQGVTYLAAQRFTTGSNGAGYALKSVLAITPRLTDSDEGKVSIYSADSSGNPGTSLYVLDNPETFLSDPLINTFTAPAGTNLERETDYFVVFEGTSGDYRVRLSESTDQDAGGADGWRIHDDHHKKIASSNWSEPATFFPARIEIRGIILPNTPAEGAAISGSKTVGQVLTADTSGITDVTAWTTPRSATSGCGSTAMTSATSPARRGAATRWSRPTTTSGSRSG